MMFKTYCNQYPSILNICLKLLTTLMSINILLSTIPTSWWKSFFMWFWK